jgi:hypothetical protein
LYGAGVKSDRLDGKVQRLEELAAQHLTSNGGYHLEVNPNVRALGSSIVDQVGKLLEQNHPP